LIIEVEKGVSLGWVFLEKLDWLHEPFFLAKPFEISHLSMAY